MHGGGRMIANIFLRMVFLRKWIALLVAVCLQVLPASADLPDFARAKPDLFCPARITAVVPLHQVNAEAGKNLGEDSGFGVVLRADSMKDVSGTLQFLAAGKIYQTRFATSLSTLTTVDSKTGGQVLLQRKYADSAPIYVAFPSSVSLEAVWIADTAVNGNAVDCLTTPFVSRVSAKEDGDMADGRISNEAIRAGARTQVRATLRDAVDPQKCTVVHRFARMIRGFTPSYPDRARDADMTGTAIAIVALSATGQVLDSTLSTSSGHPELDLETVASARRSTYAPEEFLCTPIPGYYRFSATFEMGSSAP